MVEVEPITSLLIRELRIVARDIARVSRDYDALAKILRQHLQPDIGCAKLPGNKEDGELGAPSSNPEGVPSDPFPGQLRLSYD